MKKILQKIWPDAAAVAFFVAISIVFMFPAMQGKRINQHDAVAGVGAGQELAEYYAQTGEQSRWTNALFGGMPTFQSAPSYPAYKVLNKIQSVYRLFLPAYVWYLFALLVGFYILMRVIGQKPLMSTLGAVIWAFSSYFIIIISAGHIWKVMTLAFIPPTIAGMILIYKRKYFLGFAVTALFTSFQLHSNHLQMTYYFLFVMAGIAIAIAVDAFKSKQFRQFLLSTAVLVAAGLVGIGVNASNLYHTYQYSKETMRGGSELIGENGDPDKTRNGLDRSYITNWSYGIGETFTLLVPNAKGGATNRGDEIMDMASDKNAMSVAEKAFVPIYRQLPQYWGSQPMTSGPVYVGAIVCLLFVLGLFLVKGGRKWTLVILTVLSILLAWGKNFQWFTDLFIDHMPMYSKFRTVSSILVIAEFTIPLLAVLGLSEFISRSSGGENLRKPLLISAGITGGLCLLFALFPSLLGSVITETEADAFRGLAAQYASSGSTFPLDELVDNLSAMRYKMLSADALRSFAYILAATVVLLLFSMKKLKAGVGVAVLTLLCLVDLWSVDRRYQTLDMFQRPQKSNVTFVKTAADEQILQDKALDYRVLNFTTSTFNENNTSYWHKSIGGYHAAKLRRYQDVIERFISPEMAEFYSAGFDASGLKVLNMLNTRHFIIPYKDEPIDFPNAYAYGNAWFADSLLYVGGAIEEISALEQNDPRHVAIVDRKFAESVGNLSQGALGTDPLSAINMTAYAPNRLEYSTSSRTGGVVVLSEIYYPGWRAYLDGEQIPVGRADYILRTVKVPQGEHHLVLTFDPQSLHVTDTISFIALGLLLLAFLAGIAKLVLPEIKK